MRCLVPLFALFGCVGEPDTRMCADYDSRTTVKERCIPLYGQLICSEEETTEVYCKLYFEEEEKEN